MNKEEIMKKIEKLENMKKEGNIEIRPIAIVVGGDKTMPDVKYELREVWVPAHDNTALQAQIDALYDSMKDPAEEAARAKRIEERRIREKKRRYEKELIELEDRLAYLKRWIAEHE